MRRATIAVAWMFAAALPPMLAAASTFGCCALPFHRVLHQLMACRSVAGHEKSMPAPSPQKRSSPITLFARAIMPALHDAGVLRMPSHSGARNVCALGGLRVDDDIGLHTLFGVLLI